MSHTHYNPRIDPTQFRHDFNRLEAAFLWLARGAELLPIKPFSKHLVRGYGPYLKSIRSERSARIWFEHGHHNLAICCPVHLLAIDFDDQDLFYEWSDALPIDLATTYHETSRRGFHVFYRVPAGYPGGLKLVAGAEIKKVIMVAPSELPGFCYRVVDPGAELVQVDDWQNVIASLLLSDQDPASVKTMAGGQYPSSSNDLIARLKSALPIYELATRFTELKPSGGSGRWYVGRCPLPDHRDRHPSFWIDVQRGLWGCHGCGLRGDAINLYALIHNLPIQSAIKHLAREVLG